jgi:hypothetical protein
MYIKAYRRLLLITHLKDRADKKGRVGNRPKAIAKHFCGPKWLSVARTLHVNIPELFSPVIQGDAKHVQ